MMALSAVFIKLFAMVADNRNDRTVHYAETPQNSEQILQLVVNESDFAIVKRHIVD